MSRSATEDAATVSTPQFETRSDGEANNCVLVMERFFGTGPQQAADLADEVLTSRLHQFENTTLTELPVLFRNTR